MWCLRYLRGGGSKKDADANDAAAADDDERLRSKEHEVFVQISGH